MLIFIQTHSFHFLPHFNSMGHSLFNFILFIFLLSLAHSRNTPHNAKTTLLDVVSSIQKTYQVFNFNPNLKQQQNGSSFSSSSPFSMQLHSRASIHKLSHSNYKSLTLSRLTRDSARVNSILTQLDPNFNPQKLSGPIISGTSQGSGEYFSRIGIGEPPSQAYVVLDTGSDISWVQCAPCADPHLLPLPVHHYHRPIPLLRGPIPASPSDDASAGPYVLAFRDSQAWASSFVACERKIVQQCEKGARIGCAIHASSKCKAPWWKALSGPKLSDLKEREICEVREMEECFRVAKEKCFGLAREKCLVPFRDARVKVGKGGLSLKEGVKLIGWASMPVNKMSSKCLIGGEFGVTNRRASELLSSDDCVKQILDERQHGTEY